MPHDERRDDCECPFCLLRRMIIEMAEREQGGNVFGNVRPDSVAGRWIKYQQQIANLRGHAMRKGIERAQQIVRVAGLDQRFEGSVLGPLTGYQCILRDAKRTEQMTRVKGEMALLASLITPLLPILLDAARPLAEMPTDQEARWRFYDHIALFDALVMIRTVMVDIATLDQDLVIPDIAVLEECGTLVQKVEQRMTRNEDEN